MAFLLSTFFIFSRLTLSSNLTPPSLLSLWCSLSPSNETNVLHNIIPIVTLLDSLTSVAPYSLFTTINSTFGNEHYTGLIQCQPGHDPIKCTLCAETSRRTILNLCENPEAVSAWFDGCYVQISVTGSSNLTNMNLSNHSCSNQANNQDTARFSTALGTLFLKLRAAVNIATHHGFSHGEIVYENITNHNDGKMYGFVECVRSLSPQECDSCVGKAVEKLQFYCGGENGGTMVYGPCLARFESYEFYHAGVSSGGGGGADMPGNFTVWEGENGGGRKGRLVVEYWCGGVACFLVLVLLLWLLRRTVLNRAKVGSFGSDLNVDAK